MTSVCECGRFPNCKSCEIYLNFIGPLPSNFTTHDRPCKSECLNYLFVPNFLENYLTLYM